MSDPDHDGQTARQHDAREEEPLPLETLLQAVYDGVVGPVREGSERAAREMIAAYFPLDPQTGRPAPRMVQLPLPGPNGTPVQRDVPLFTLTRHNDLTVESLNMRMTLFLHHRRGEDGKPGLAVGFAANQGEGAKAEIEIRFGDQGTAEGVARINDAIVNHIGAGGR